MANKAYSRWCIDKICQCVDLLGIAVERPMPTMNVSLPAELATFVEEEVESGEYGTASEVIRDGLRRLRHAKATREERAAVLRREVGRGIEQARAGKFSRRSVADIAAAVRTRGGKRA